MSLSKENIKFIDNYLKNNEVIYFDIRMEMLDHIATAVEQKIQAENLDFYEAFKSYMVANKKELMKENEKTQKLHFKNCLPFLKFLIQPKSLLIEIVLVTLMIALKKYFTFTSSGFFMSMVFLMLIFVFVQFYIYYFIVKDRLYAVEKSAIVLLLLYNGLNFVNSTLNIGNKSEKANFWFAMVSIVITTMYLLFYIKEVRKHRKFYLKRI